MRTGKVMYRCLRVALVLLVLSALGSASRTPATTLPHVPETSAQGPTSIQPLPQGKAQSGVVRFVALGDTGTGGPSQLAVAKQLVAFHDARPYETAILLGDNVYPNGNPTQLVEKFERPYAELLRRGVRFQAVLGNHDVTLGRTAQIHYGPFNMGGRSYYSFVKGDGLIEFFALDSNRLDNEQVRWLESALRSSQARWKIVVMHHPLYSSANKHGSSRTLQSLLEPLFVRYAISAVFAGHDHVYERTTPQKGIQYFVSGAGGQLRRGNINRQSPLLAAGNDQVHSFMYVEITRDRFSFWAVSENGEILDSGHSRPGKSLNLTTALSQLRHNGVPPVPEVQTVQNPNHSNTSVILKLC